MTDTWLRLLVPIAVIACALLVAVASSKLRKPLHPSVVVGDIGERPGVVLFTSTDCTNCKQTIVRLKESDVQFREVTHELEPHRFEEWEVVAVPSTVFIDASSNAVAVLTGVPSARRITAAARKAGLVPQ